MWAIGAHPFKASSNQINTEDDSTDDSSMSYQKPSKAKKNSTTKSNENDDALRDLTNAAVNICTELTSSHQNVGLKSAEQAFAEFIAFSLQGMEEPERSLRRNKIFETLTAPINKFS